MSPTPQNSLRETCPHLPTVRADLSYRTIRALGGRRDAVFYEICMEYAQTLCMAGKTAQAILQLNRAWSADLPPDAPILSSLPPPYMALRWMLEHRQEGGFLGNPVRHFQHLATRVSGQRREVRSWRAWACFQISEKVLPSDKFPRDVIQIEREKLILPSLEVIMEHLDRLGWKNELLCFREALE